MNAREQNKLVYFSKLDTHYKAAVSLCEIHCESH